MHGSNVTGEIFPIEALGAVCKEKGILFVVDGAQSAGLIPINTTKMNIDYLAIAPHKGLYAPMGTGILIANKDIPFPIIEGGTGSQSSLPYLPEEYPERLESGTLNLPGIMGISAGIDFIKKKGMDRMYRAEMGLIERLYNGLKNNSQVHIYSEKPKLYKTLPVLSFNHKKLDSSRVAEYLNNKGIAVRPGLHCSALAHKRLGTVTSGTVRVSPSVFNTVADIDALLSAIKFIK
jgi:selenocysteine lyase/cysteine desulfurase